MTLRTATGASGTNGVAYSAGTAVCSALVGTGTMTATNSNLLAGTTLDFLVNESTNLIGLSFTGTSDATGVACLYVYFFALPGTANVLIDFRSASATAARFSTSATNKFVIQNQAGATLNTFGTSFVINTWYRLEMAVTVGASTTTGTVVAGYYLGAGTTAQDGGLYSSGATVNTGTAALAEYRGGKLSTINAVNAQFAQFGVNNGTTTFIGPISGTNVPPTCSAGTAQSLLAGSSFTLSGTDADSDGTVTGRAWTCTQAPAGVTPSTVTSSISNAATATATVTLSTAGVYQFTYTVTDNSAATNFATVNEYVYPGPSTDVTPVAVTVGSWTNIGGAASPLAAITDTNTATYLESPGTPTTSQPLFVTLGPCGPGTINVYVENYYNGGTLTLSATLYKADGTTFVAGPVTAAFNASDAETLLTFDNSTLGSIPAATDRSALVVKVTAN